MIPLVSLAVLTDFDGTVTIDDVGSSLIDKYADPKTFIYDRQWKKGLIGSEKAHRIQYSSITAKEDQLEEYILKMEIHPSFFPFVEYLHQREIPLSIVSDGFDFYIKPLLEKYSLTIPYYSNHMDPLHKSFSFPYQDSSCWRCANCKVKSVKYHLKRGERVIYIGDGLSDLYGALISDVIFTKRGKNLEKSLLERGVRDFISFDSFSEISRAMDEGLSYRFQEVSLRECSFKGSFFKGR